MNKTKGQTKRQTATSRESSAPPEPIVAYLHAMTDPDSLKDREAIREIDERLAQDELDPAERLDLLLRRRLLNRLDIGALEDAFLDAVPDYLTRLGLDLTHVRDDFLAVGVPPEVVDRISTTNTEPARVGGVSVHEVREYALARGEPFTQQDLMNETGASRGTVAKVVKELVQNEQVVKTQGRPIIYEVR